MNGEIFNIQKFCVNDGPGIRTTIFFKGCPLRCLWCHNPESQVKDKQIMFYADKCTHCGKCRNLEINDADFICFNNAKEICGKTVSADEVIEEVMKDLLFYKNSGGVTLSGGEPLFQFDFAIYILKKCKENGIHTALETCGYANSGKIIEIAEYTDLFLYDFKESNSKKHKLYTGVDNKLIIENLLVLNKMQKNVVLRCPIITGYNDRTEHFDEICYMVNDLTCIKAVDIEPYHLFGEDKYTSLGKKKPEIEQMSETQIDEIIGYIKSKVKVPVKRA